MFPIPSTVICDAREPAGALRVGGGEMMLQDVRASPMVTEETEPGGNFALYFRVDDVDGVVAKLPDGTETVKPLQTTWYGMKEIWVRDPDGYVITIGTPRVTHFSNRKLTPGSRFCSATACWSRWRRWTTHP